MPSRFRLVVTDFIREPLDIERRILGDIADVDCLDAYNEDQLVGRIENADAIMIYHNLSLTRRTLERLTRCKLIVRCGVGFDNVDHAFARSRGIPLANVPDYGTEDVADTAIGMMLTLTRGIHYLNSRLRGDPRIHGAARGTLGQGSWSYTLATPVHRLRGRVFGIVGLGRIGSAAALRAKAIGMDVAFYDPLKPDGFDKALGVRRVETFDELLKQAWVLSLHCPLTTETRRMVDAAALARMTPGSFLINTARGAIVDTAAIPGAIASGQLAGAGIDVLEEEPPAPDNPIVAAWRDPHHPAHHRLILNPHSAFYSEDGLADMRIKGAQACRRAIEGLVLRNVVN